MLMATRSDSRLLSLEHQNPKPHLHAAFCTFDAASFAEYFICSAAESVEVDTFDLMSFAVLEAFSLGVWLEKGRSMAWADIC